MARIERARGAILDGDLGAATDMLALVERAGAPRDHQRITDDIDSALLARWRLDIHDGRASATLPLLAAHMADAGVQRVQRMRHALRAKLLYALALAHAGQRDRARNTVMQALQQAQGQGLIRIFHDEGPQLLALIAQLLDADQLDGAALRSFAEKIIGAAVADSAPGRGSRTRGAGNGEITERERDVLRLLACGHGNQAIAEKLFVSVTTVRTHLRNINQKFDTHTRTQAIAFARTRGIIG
jgi:LuxR family maltose regulon positive regulatory protein